MDFENLVREIQEFKGVSRKSSIDNVISLLNEDIVTEYKKLDEYLIEIPYSQYDNFTYYLNKNYKTEKEIKEQYESYDYKCK